MKEITLAGIALALLGAVSVAAAPVAATSPSPVVVEDDPECEPKTTHHEVFNEEGQLIGVFVVKTKRNCETLTAYTPVGPPE